MSKFGSPVVTVVIPTYNHAGFLRETLESVRRQTFADWEAVVVNNFSEDNTIEVVESFADPRIRIENFRNQGVIAASRNRGIALARGRFLAYLDSDDLWYPDKLARCLARLDDGYDVVCHGERWVGEGRKREVLYGPESRASFEALLFEGNCMSTSAVVARREWIEAAGGFREDPSIITAEDYDLWLQLARDGARIGFVPEILGEYRIHGGNQSRAVLRNMEAARCVVHYHLGRMGGVSATDRLRARRREALIYYSGARGLQDNGQHGEAWPYFFRAIGCWPFFAKLYAAMLLNALHRRLV